MKVKITKKCVIEVLPDSVVEVSEKQLALIKGYYEEEPHTAIEPKKVTKRKR